MQEDEDGRGDVSHLSDVEDSITEQTHHIIIPSYTSWFNYNGWVEALTSLARVLYRNGFKMHRQKTTALIWESVPIFRFMIMVVLNIT